MPSKGDDNALFSIVAAASTYMYQSNDVHVALMLLLVVINLPVLTRNFFVTFSSGGGGGV